MAGMGQRIAVEVDSEDVPEALPPLFRWPGGKRWLTSRLIDTVRQSEGRYFEPFFGGGALFFALRPGHATISDANADLMLCYELVRDHADELAALLRDMSQDEASYYVVRASRPVDKLGRAARFLYLATLAFNGIQRVNRKGEFNVPYGHREYPGLGDAAILRLYRDALQGVEILTGDFGTTLASAKAGDFVYLDPPYTIHHANNGFRKYNERIFSWEDQERLAAVAHDLDERGCVVVVSNAHHESTALLYPDFRSLTITRTSRISAATKGRRTFAEYLFTNLPERSHDG